MPPAVTLRSVTSNVGWSVLSKTSTFGLKFVTVPILARLLSPEEFGIVAVALTAVLFVTMVGGAGLAAALVVEREEDETTIHTVFWANLAVAFLLAAGLFLSAAPIAAAVGAAGGAAVLKVLALIVPLQLAGDVAYALLARRMAFDRDAFWSVIAESAAALSAVALALGGWGLWALVAQVFISASVRLAGLLIATGYRPRLAFSFRRLRRLLGFGVPLMGSEVFNFITFQSPLVIVSRMLGITEAGAYSAANRFSSIPNQVVLAALMGVLFPTFSHIADDAERRTRALMLATRTCTVLLAPMMFGDQWAWAWPVLGLLAVSKGIMSPCSTYIPYLKGVGRGDVLWWVAVPRAALVSAAVVWGARSGGLVGAMVWLCVANAVTLVFYCHAVFRTNGAPFLESFLVTCRPMIAAFLMALAVRLFVGHLEAGGTAAVWQVVIGALAGAFLYAMMITAMEYRLMREVGGLLKGAWARPARREATG